jgi:hypothetical protein
MVYVCEGMYVIVTVHVGVSDVIRDVCEGAATYVRVAEQVGVLMDPAVFVGVIVTEGVATTAQIFEELLPVLS